MKDPRDIIIRPVVSEKSYAAFDGNVYTFVVAHDANKIEIRKAVEELRVQVAGGLLQKTISIGISGYPEDSDTFWQAVKFADVALYHAKDTGRNRVVRFTKALWKDGANEKDY